MAQAIWSKTETACLIDLVAKNTAIWNTKAKEYMDPSKKTADLWPSITAEFTGKTGAHTVKYTPVILFQLN